MGNVLNKEMVKKLIAENVLVSSVKESFNRMMSRRKFKGIDNDESCKTKKVCSIVTKFRFIGITKTGRIQK